MQKFEKYSHLHSTVGAAYGPKQQKKQMTNVQVCLNPNSFEFFIIVREDKTGCFTSYVEKCISVFTNLDPEAVNKA